MMRELMLCVFILIHCPYVLCENSVEHTTDISTQELATDVSNQDHTKDVSIEEHEMDVSMEECETDVCMKEDETDVSIEEHKTDVTNQELATDVSTQEHAKDFYIQEQIVVDSIQEQIVVDSIQEQIVVDSIQEHAANDSIEEHEMDVSTQELAPNVSTQEQAKYFSIQEYADVSTQEHTFKNPNLTLHKSMNNEEIHKTIQPLCIQELNTIGLVKPCDADNRSPACFYTPINKIYRCKTQTSWKKVIPLCILSGTNQHVVVGCNDSSANLCPLVNSNPLFLAFCKRSGVKICLGKKHMFQPCYNTRVKRFEPQVPNLDVDGYYASCENCSLNVRMVLDEETNEQPIIEIRSEPLKEEDEEMKKVLENL